MATGEAEIELAQLLITLGEREHEIEEIRLKLTKQSDFDPFLLFKNIDKRNRGSLCSADFKKFFR